MTQEEQLKQIVEDAWENRDRFTAGDASPILRAAIAEVIRQLDCGQLRVAEKKNGEWIVNQWTKKAVLLSFRLQENFAMPVGSDGSPAMHFYDKVSSKFANYTQDDFARGGFRVVPPAVARLGSYIGKNVVMMPSFVNIGAYVDEGTMIDTWATVGSCAQIGKHVHLSGGVGIGGVDCAGVCRTPGNAVGKGLLDGTVDPAAQLTRTVGRHGVPRQGAGGCRRMAQRVALGGGAGFQLAQQMVGNGGKLFGRKRRKQHGVIQPPHQLGAEKRPRFLHGLLPPACCITVGRTKAHGGSLPRKIPRP